MYLQFVLETQARFFLLCMYARALPYVELLSIYKSGVIQALHRSVVCFKLAVTDKAESARNYFPWPTCFLSDQTIQIWPAILDESVP